MHFFEDLALCPFPAIEKKKSDGRAAEFYIKTLLKGLLERF